MAFKFRFDNILKHHQIKQNLSKKDYMEAQALVDDKMELIKSYYEQIEGSRKTLSGAEKGEISLCLTGQQSESFIQLTLKKIDRAREELRNLMMLAEEKKEVLLEATKELKKFEHLKEKKRQEYKKQMAKKEAKQLDEMSVMRHHLKESL